MVLCLKKHNAMTRIDIEFLRIWFQETKRDFPWRKTKDPYRVLISEVMLQQTQASRVVLFFEKWMSLFPSIEALAKADEKDVIKSWEGLGYYSRARALHSAAKYIVDTHAGKLPDTKLELLKIKGIGEYTSSAILSFGFYKKEAPVDANVVRLFCRYFQIDDDIAKQKTRALIQKLVFDELPDEKPWEIAESFIELGATVCKSKNPTCLSCPLQDGCKSFSMRTQNEYPKSSKKTIYEKLVRTVCVIVSDNNVLVQKVPENRPCSGLYEFLYLEGLLSSVEAQSILLNKLGIDSLFSRSFDPINQSFTKYRVKLHPHVFYINQKPTMNNYEWHSLSSIKTLPFSSGHKKIIDLMPW